MDLWSEDNKMTINMICRSEVQEVEGELSPVEPQQTEPDIKEDKQTPTPVVDTSIRTNQSSTTSETKTVDETMEDKSMTQLSIRLNMDT